MASGRTAIGLPSSSSAGADRLRLREPDMSSVSELGASVSAELSGASVPGSIGKSDSSSLSSGSGVKDSARPPVARLRSCREVKRLSNPPLDFGSLGSG